MDDALLVGLLEGLGDLLRDGERLVDGNRPALQPLREVLALDQLHDEEVSGRPSVASRSRSRRSWAMLGVIERGEELGLALEAGEALGVGGEGLGEELERDVAAELRVGGALDLAHPAGADGGGDAVMRERLADQVVPSYFQFTMATAGLGPCGRRVRIRKRWPSGATA